MPPLRMMTLGRCFQDAKALRSPDSSMKDTTTIKSDPSQSVVLPPDPTSHATTINPKLLVKGIGPNTIPLSHTETYLPLFNRHRL